MSGRVSFIGPKYDYFANATKTWLVIKKKHIEAATASFAVTSVQVTSSGRRYLGAAIGEQKFGQKN